MNTVRSLFRPPGRRRAPQREAGTLFPGRIAIARARPKTARRKCMRRKGGIWSVLALLLIAGLLVTACQQGGQQGGGTAAGAADPNGELTTNTGSEPDTIDPQKESFVNE